MMTEESSEDAVTSQQEHSKKDEWLSNYYQKSRAEKQMDLDRRDKFTNWGLTIFLGFLALYADFIERGFTPMWRVTLLYMSGALFLRFFIHACLVYAWVHKWNALTKFIEKYWISEKTSPTIEEVIKEIEKYDHSNKVPIKRREILWGQLKTGYMLIFIGIITLMVYDLFYLNSMIQCYVKILSVFAIFYLIYEGYMFYTYSNIDTPSKKCKKEQIDSDNSV